MAFVNMQSLVLCSIFLALLTVLIKCETEEEALKYVGCFDLSYSLSQNFHTHMSPISLEKCIRHCQKVEKTRYAGLEQSDNFCYCGDDIAEMSIKRENSSCNVQCSELSSRMCGGDWLMSLYDISILPDSNETKTKPSDENIRFLVGTSSGVRQYNSSNLDTFDNLFISNEWALAVDYHLEKNLLFVFSKRKLYMTSLDPKTISINRPLVNNVSTCEGFAVDWVNDRIYWTDCNNGLNIIKSIDLNGGNETVVFTRTEEPAAIKRMTIDPYHGTLFWTADGVIESCDMTGNSFQTNMSTTDVNVRELTLDLAAQRVYYVGRLNQTWSLYSMDYEGGDTQELFSAPQMKSVYGLGVLREQVYWVNYASVRDVLYNAPLQSTSEHRVEMLKVIDRAVWHMRVLHPDLQKPPKRDPCKNRGCEYRCVVQNSKGLCECPEEHELQEDGITCIHAAHLLKPEIARHNVSPTVLLVGILLVLAMVFISGVFVYLTDRYWTHLQIKLLGTPYTRTRHREGSVTPTYDTTDDNVVLI